MSSWAHCSGVGRTGAAAPVVLLGGRKTTKDMGAPEVDQGV